MFDDEYVFAGGFELVQSPSSDGLVQDNGGSECDLRVETFC